MLRGGATTGGDSEGDGVGRVAMVRLGKLALAAVVDEYCTVVTL